MQEQESKQADYNSAVARQNAAQAEAAADQGDVDRLQALEDYKRITAPFDGVVTARETDIGALINAGSGTGGGNGPELFRVADIHEMRVYVQVPQQLTAGIHPGLTATLNLPQHPDTTFKATVATTSNAINESARTLLVELHAANPDGQLQPGAYAQVNFELPGNPHVVRLPTSALIFRENGLEVATIGPDNKIEMKPITLGRNLGTEVEVLKGLTLTDRVVNSPPDSLSAGDAVRIAGQQSSTGGNARAVRQTGKRGRSGGAATEALANPVCPAQNSLAAHPDVPETLTRKCCNSLRPPGQVTSSRNSSVPSKFGRSVIERDERRHLGRKTLLEIGRLQRAALDVNNAVRRRGDEPDCGQRARGAVRLDVGVDADAGITARRRLDLAFNDVSLRVRRERGRGTTTPRRAKFGFDAVGWRDLLRHRGHFPMHRFSTPARSGNRLACRPGSA